MSDPDVALLARALVAWGATFDPALADPIQRLGWQLARGRGPLEVLRDDGERVSIERQWHALAAGDDPGDVDRLLAVRWSTDVVRMLARVRALARRPPDPRIARRLAEVARVFPSRHGAELLGETCRLIAASGGAACAELLRVAEAGRGRNVREPFEAARAVLAGRRTAPAARDVVAALIGRVGDGAELPALWADVYAEPGAIERRLVLADALAQLGDPRGEMILHQIASADGDADRRAAARANRAIQDHLDAWIGPLPGVDRDTARFERGFVVALACTAPPHDLEASLDQPAWRTVEQLALTVGPAPIARLAANLPRLQRLELPIAPAVPVEGTFPTVATAICARAWEPTARAFPNLRVLAGAWSGAALTSIRRFASTHGLDALVHLGRGAFAEEQVADRRGPAEVRFVTDRALFTPRGWYGRAWPRRDDAELIWAGGREHDVIDAIVRTLIASGVRTIRYGDAPGATRARWHEQTLARVLEAYRGRVVFADTARAFDPFASGVHVPTTPAMTKSVTASR